MKLNLGCGNDIRHNYLNIDLNVDNPQVIKEDMRRLENIPINSCDEILANHVIQHIYPEELTAVLNVWLTKLKVGGRLYISGYDLALVSNAIIHKQLEPVEYSKLMLSRGPIPTVGAYTLELLVKMFRTDPNLVIDKKSYIGTYEYEIVITKEK